MSMLKITVVMILLIDCLGCFSHYGLVSIMNRLYQEHFGLSEEISIKYISRFKSSAKFLAPLGALFFTAVTRKYSLLVGTFLVALGHLSISWNHNNLHGFLFSLVLIVIGSSFISTNILALANGQYRESEKQAKAQMFSLYYLFLNIGAAGGRIIVSYVALNHGFKIALHIGCICMFLCWIIYIICLKNITTNESIEIATENNYESTTTQKRITACLFVLFLDFLYTIVAEQMETSMDNFALKNLNRTVMGFEIPNGWFNAINPLIVIFCVVPIRSSSLYKRLTQFENFILGILITVASMFILIFCAAQAHYFGQAHWLVYALFQVVFTLGEICLAVFTISYVIQYRPIKYSKTFLGIPQLVTGISLFVSGEFVVFINSYFDKIGVFISSLFVLSSILLVVFFAKDRFNNVTEEFVQENKKIDQIIDQNKDK